MSRVLPLRPTEHPPEMHERAMDNLRYIRETMEAAATFTAVSGWGTVLIGITAIGAAGLSAATSSNARWMFIWLAGDCLSLALSMYAMVRKARVSHVKLWSEPARKMVFSFAPPMMVGALLTLVFYEHRMMSLVPGMWMLLYGVAVVAAGTFSVRIIPVMGFAFMTVGSLALFAPASWATATMAAGF